MTGFDISPRGDTIIATGDSCDEKRTNPFFLPHIEAHVLKLDKTRIEYEGRVGVQVEGVTFDGAFSPRFSPDGKRAIILSKNMFRLLTAYWFATSAYYCLILVHCSPLLADEPQEATQAPVTMSLHANVRTPTRDGVTLRADIYLPKKEGSFPTILVRTPYSASLGELSKDRLSTRGAASSRLNSSRGGMRSSSKIARERVALMVFGSHTFMNAMMASICKNGS